MVASRWSKVKQYPRPHVQKNSYYHSAEIANQYYTNVPIAWYDEGLGAPSGYNAHPEHGSFAVTSAGNHYVDSKVNQIITEIRFSLTKGAIETDKIHALKVAFMPIMMAFKENYDAVDEVSTQTVAQVLHMQTESTDRQGYPLYNGTDLTAKFTSSSDIPSIPGLTTDTKLEGITLVENGFYNALHFATTSGKIKKSIGGLNFLTLTRSKPTVTIRIKLRGKTKAMNPYTYFGVVTGCPSVDSHYQIPASGDTTAIPHVEVSVITRTNEWNQGYNMEKI